MNVQLDCGPAVHGLRRGCLAGWERRRPVWSGRRKSKPQTIRQAGRRGKETAEEENGERRGSTGSLDRCPGRWRTPRTAGIETNCWGSGCGDSAAGDIFYSGWPSGDVGETSPARYDDVHGALLLRPVADCLLYTIHSTSRSAEVTHACDARACILLHFSLVLYAPLPYCPPGQSAS